MSGIERVKYGDRVIAIIVRKGLKTDGVKFFTPEDYPFQLGVHTRAKGMNVKPHLHREISRKISITQEMLHIAKGKVVVDFYVDTGEKIRSINLSEGDTILLSHGGHGIRILEDTKIIEIKQGPYPGTESEKIFL